MCGTRSVGFIPHAVLYLKEKRPARIANKTFQTFWKKCGETESCGIWRKALEQELVIAHTHADIIGIFVSVCKVCANMLQTYQKDYL